MRIRVLFVVFILPLIGLSQGPVDVSVRTKKINEHHYELAFDFAVQKGWHVYVLSDSLLSLDGVKISIDNENCTLVDEGIDTKSVSQVRDVVFDNKSLLVYAKDFSLKKNLLIHDMIPPVVNFSIKAFASNNKEFIPVDLTRRVELAAVNANVSNLRIPSIDIHAPLSDCGDANRASSKGLLAIFLLGFGGGLLALLTPCVFPMVPLTVSYFTGKANSRTAAMRQGLWYGASILLIYVLASIPFHVVGKFDPQVFNTISTNPWINIFFFVVFILFALSFFGWFEITLPSSLSNLSGSKSKLGSAAGIFFMALTLAVVSFSCTGPILGSLLVGSVSSVNGAWALTSGMAGFGMALGLPFALFALFPQLIQKLPKSGSWMEVVKKSLAFVELALAIKFLSNADLVEHWGFLKREVFVGLWIIIFLSLSFYLLGVFEKRKPFHPSPVLRIVKDDTKVSLSKGRYLFGTLSLLFTLYLTIGLTQTSFANLKLLSGFAPPLSYSIYGKDNVRGKGLDPDVINDYAKAVQLAKQHHKPLLIDFTGWACVNCRKMEENVWTNNEIKDFIKEKFILVSLYVDDRGKLPVSERTVFTNTDSIEKEIVTIGDRYSTMEAENFRQASQPLYVILSPDEKLMNHPVGYTPDVKEYERWLECGYSAFDRFK